MNINKYLMVLAVGTAMVSVSLLLFKIPIVAIWELLLIAIPLVTLWLYYNWRESKKRLQQDILVKIQSLKCKCHICKHSDAKDCIKVSCACCIITRKDQIFGHEPSW
jgi:hypothetical protein